MGRDQRLIAVTGGAGRLGRRLALELDRLGRRHVAPARAVVDWSNELQVRPYLGGLGSSVVVALASYTDVARAELEPNRCTRDTVLTARATATVCQRLGLPLVYVSTDYVVPLLLDEEEGGVYAQAKLLAEQEVLARRGYVVRVAFTTPEQVDGWSWANDYTLSHRWWVEDAARELAAYLSRDSWRAVDELGPEDALTPAQLLRSRYPRHPALAQLVTDPEDMRERVGFAAPRDTRFHWREVPRLTPI